MFLFTGDVTALSIALDSPPVQGIEGGNVTVCANISGNISLEIPVSATLGIFRAEQSGKERAIQSVVRTHHEYFAARLVCSHIT